MSQRGPMPELTLGTKLADGFGQMAEGLKNTAFSVFLLERNAIVALRMIFSALGALAVYGLGFRVFFAESEAFQNGQLNAAAYPPYAAVLAVGMCVAILVTAFGTRHLVLHLPGPSPSQQLSTLS